MPAIQRFHCYNTNLMFRALTRAALSLRPFPHTLPIRYTCTNHKSQSLQITRELLNNHHQYRPWKTIHLLHSLTMNNLTQLTSQDQQQVQTIITSLTNELHQVPHKEVNMLMEILKEHGYHYTRDLPIFRALNKQTKLLFGRDFKGQQFFRSLFIMKSLKFPINTINKMLDYLIEVSQVPVGVREARYQIPLTTLLKITIFSLQEPFVTIPIAKKWLEFVLKPHAESLTALCSLYHIAVVTQKFLQGKVDYQYLKTNAREILFNPYQSLEDQEINIHQQQKENQQADSTKQSKTSSEKNNVQSQHKIQLKTKLTQMANSVLKIVSNSIDVKKLQSSIVKSVLDNAQPLTKEHILYACDIADLKPTIQNYLSEHFQDLTPVELIYLLKRCSKELAIPTLDQYLNILGPHMSLQQQAYLHLQSHRLFHKPVTSDLILSLLAPLSRINYQQFLAIARMTEALPSAQQQRTGAILALIKQKTEQEAASPEHKQ